MKTSGTLRFSNFVEKLTSFQSGLHGVVEVEVDVGKDESGKG